MGCTGKACGWQMSRTGTMGCVNGSGTCAAAMLVKAKPSGFHDQTLIDATVKISDILGAIPPDKQGRQLSFVNTEMGTLLAWVSHDPTTASDPDAITAESDAATVATALGLIYPQSTQTGA